MKVVAEMSGTLFWFVVAFCLTILISCYFLWIGWTEQRFWQRHARGVFSSAWRRTLRTPEKDAGG